jgi:hypothetical protein
MKKLFFAAPIIAALIILGCSSTPPTKLEQKLFTVSTNYYPQQVVVTNSGQVVTQFVQVPTYTYAPGPVGDTAKGVAGTIGSLAAPGVGGPIATGVVGLGLALWSWIRGSKQSATANNLSQSIEVARELIKSLPNGSAIDSTYTSWLTQHQAEAGVLPQVLDILEKSTDNPAAKQVSDQLRAALAALQNPTAPKV